MKSAICFSGDLRDLEITKDYWIKFIHTNNLDVYCSFWEDTLNLDDYTEFNNIFKPSKSELEKRNVLEGDLDILRREIKCPELGLRGLKDSYYERAHSLSMMSMWYKVWRANMLTKDIDYDVIVRARIDTFFPSEFKLEINNYLNITNELVGVWNWPNCWGPTDVFAYGSPSIMNYYSSLFLKFYSYFQRGELLEIPENILRVHLSKKDITIRQIPEDLYLRGGLKTKGKEIEFSNSLNWNFEPHVDYKFYNFSTEL